MGALLSNLGAAVPGERFFEGIDTELRAERVDNRHASTARLTQSMITTRYRKPLAIGMQVRSEHHT